MDLLVSPAWVADHLKDPDLVILDATLPPVGVAPAPDVRGRYAEAHIPGAVFFDIEELSDHSTALPHMLPTAEIFGREMSRLGVADGMTIVVYEQGDVFSAPRAWWMLRTMGAHRVFVLDGGLRAWVAARLPVESGTVGRPAAEFRAKLNADAVRDFEQVQQMLEEEAQILDARAAGRFQGTSPEPRPGLRSGHMPGAVNVPYMELTAGERMRSADELRAVFASKGVDLRRPVTTTCGSGVTAAVIALGLALCGADDVSLYDGSWAEYAQRPEAVIEGASGGAGLT